MTQRTEILRMHIQHQPSGIGILLTGVVLLALVLLSGCNIVGAALVVIEGPPTTDAVYQLPADRPAVIFVDDRGSRLPRRSMRLTIASSAGEDLLERGVVTTLIEPRAALEATSGEAPARPLDLVTLGRNAKAEFLVYASIREFTLSPDGQTIAPRARLRVKVVDTVGTVGRIWPDTPEGYELVYAARESIKTPPRSPAELVALQDRVAADIGKSLARLFYKHETRQRTAEP
jgi:hypothetical protein